MRWKRSHCACWKCRAFCKFMPGRLIPRDLKRIREFLGVTDEVLDESLAASPGPLMENTLTGKQFRMAVVVPATKEDGSCVFLDEKEQCRVHAVAPFGCGYFDGCKVDEEKGEDKQRWSLSKVEDSKDYRRRVFNLRRQGRKADKPEDQLKRLKQYVKGKDAENATR